MCWIQAHWRSSAGSWRSRCISAVVGATIIWRRPDNHVGALLLIGAVLLASDATAWWILVIVGLSGTSTLHTTLIWWAIVSVLPAVFVLFPSVGLFFPDGRLPGPRWRCAVRRGGHSSHRRVGPSDRGAACAPTRPATSSAVRSSSPASHQPSATSAACWRSSPSSARSCLRVGSVTVRYRRSAGVERAQVKWLVAAVAGQLDHVPGFLPRATSGSSTSSASSPAASSRSRSASRSLRYRLYDIDRLISRTLSWAIVTGGVVTIFVLLVVGLQASARGPDAGRDARGRAVDDHRGRAVPAGPPSRPGSRRPAFRPRPLRRPTHDRGLRPRDPRRGRPAPPARDARRHRAWLRPTGGRDAVAPARAVDDGTNGCAVRNDSRTSFR